MQILQKQCEVCENLFKSRFNKKRNSYKRFCSSACYHKKGHSEESKEKMRQAKLKNPSKYWLGKKMPKELVEKLSKAKIGKRLGVLNNRYGIGAGKGKDHPMWKGDKVKYHALHSWVERELGKPTTCEHCGKVSNNRRIMQWANKSRKYYRDLKDWLPLCMSCHYKYDRK